MMACGGSGGRDVTDVRSTHELGSVVSRQDEEEGEGQDSHHLGLKEEGYVAYMHRGECDQVT